MTWYYESFWVRPHGWQDWAKRYPKVECRWKLRVIASRSGKWKIVQDSYGIMMTQLDEEYLSERFDNWQDAVARAHDLVSTVATSHRGDTWPVAKARIESEEDAVLF